MSILDYANVGLRAQTGTNGVRRAPQRASVGWTSPTSIYQRQREIQVSAAALNSDVTVNVKREAFKAAWKSWYEDWTAFFRKYQTDGWAKLGAVTYTDALAAQTETYRRQLLNWYDAYSREKDGDKPMPPPSAPAPPDTPLVSPSPASEDPFLPMPKVPGLEVPWYVWVGLGAAVVGAGYLAYRHWFGVRKEMESDRAMLKERALGMMALRDPGEYMMIHHGHGGLPPTYDQFRGQQSCLCRKP